VVQRNWWTDSKVDGNSNAARCAVRVQIPPCKRF